MSLEMSSLSTARLVVHASSHDHITQPVSSTTLIDWNNDSRAQACLDPAQASKCQPVQDVVDPRARGGGGGGSRNMLYATNLWVLESNMEHVRRSALTAVSKQAYSSHACKHYHNAWARHGPPQSCRMDAGFALAGCYRVRKQSDGRYSWHLLCSLT